MLFRNETNKTDFIHLYCRDVSAPMEYCRAVHDGHKQLEAFTYFTPKQFKEYLAGDYYYDIISNYCYLNKNYIIFFRDIQSDRNEMFYKKVLVK